MDYIEVFKDGELIDVVGVYCGFDFSCIQTMVSEFETADIEGIHEDGLYKIECWHESASYIDGGLAEGAYYDFKVISHKKEEGTELTLGV